MGDVNTLIYNIHLSFRKFKWVLRYNKLSNKDISILDSLFGYKGLPTSLSLIGKEFGVNRTGVSKIVNRMSMTNILCPICREEHNLLIIKRGKDEYGGNDENIYDLSPLIVFLSHVDSHSIEEIDESNEEYLNSNKWNGPEKTAIGWQKLRILVLEKYNYTCQGCFIHLPNLDVHHIKPSRLFPSRAKSNTLDNLICYCRSCHGVAEHKILS